LRLNFGELSTLSLVEANLSIEVNPRKGLLGLLILLNSWRKPEESRRKSRVHTILETVLTSRAFVKRGCESLAQTGAHLLTPTIYFVSSSLDKKL
jgi:hypothetical protein